MTDNIPPPNPSRRRLLSWLPGPIPAANADLAAEAERLDEVVADLQTGAATETDAAAPDKTGAAPQTGALLQNEIEIARRLEALERLINERLSQSTSEMERSHLEWLRDQVKYLIVAFLGATGTAIFEALAGDQRYEPLKAWMQAQPASSVQLPEAATTRAIDGDQVHRLHAVMQDRHRPAQERLEAGRQLSDLGVLPEGLDDFIAVPGTDFRIGKYPVTNYQFRRFVEAGGYGAKGGERPPWWSEWGWERRQENDWTAPGYWDTDEYNRPTLPVVGVSWYEADAYCAWLNHTASHAHLPGRAHYLPASGRARLPGWEEWMLSARNGCEQAPDKAVDYPWGGVFDPALANTSESNLGQPTPVDMYADGATPAGIYDLVGNVSEWTCDPYDLYELYWYMSAGCWDDANRVRVSVADWDYPDERHDYYGFRVVVVPIARSRQV